MTSAKTSSALRAHERFVRNRVRMAVAGGAISLKEVIARVPGVFPLVLAEKMRELGVTATESGKVGKADQHPVTSGKGTRRFLLPHPLDYDWRFTRTALETLRDHVRKVGGERPKIHCFGCPSVERFLRQDDWHSGVTLLDRNGALHNVDFASWAAESDESLTLAHGVVITDPPWYPMEFKKFLWSIRESCPEATDVFLAGPSMGTRPGVKSEMKKLFSWSEKIGFGVVSHWAYALPYVMPLFELNTLNAFNAHDVPMDWRRADLWHLKLKSKPLARKPVRNSAVDSWTERQFGAVRVRVRTDAPAHGSTDLVPLGINGFLGSVSSRDPLRQKATVVTSGGRFFSCENPLGFLTADGESDLTLNANSTLQLPEAGLKNWSLTYLIQTEQAEAERYYELVRKVDDI